VLDNFSIAIALEVTTGLHVEVDNDAHAFGLAEAHLGAAAGYDSAVCLTVGTGVGGAIIHGGTVWRGHGGLAGELGHLVLDPEASRFFEQEVGAGAVVAEYRRLAENPTADVDAELVARFADSGDNAARQALALCGKRLGVGLAILVNLLNPQRIVIGGGVVGAGEWFLGPARIEGERRAWAQSWAQCEVVSAALGPMAGAIGAALLGLEEAK
jgi:glucokinase